MLTSKQRADLRALATKLDEVVQIGKSELTPEVTKAVEEVLEKRELIKIGVLKNCVISVKEIADIICERTHSEVVQVIGSKIVLYRRSKTLKSPAIELKNEK